MADRRSRRFQAAAWVISFGLHSATLYAFSLPLTGPWRVAVLGGQSSVVRVELLASRADAGPETPEDNAAAVRAEVEPSPALVNVSRAERVTTVSFPPPIPAALVLDDSAPSPAVPQSLRRRAQRPSQAEAATPPSLDRPQRSPMPPLRVAAAAASADGLGLDRSVPQPLDNPQPVYPPAAIANGWQGRVLLRLSVNAAGRVEKTQIASSSGFSILDEAALAAVRQWRFWPATQGGVAVRISLLLPVVFDLSSYPAGVTGSLPLSSPRPRAG